MAYPDSYDTLPTFTDGSDPRDTTPSAVLTAAEMTAIVSAVTAIQAELGLTPSGALATVAARLDAMAATLSAAFAVPGLPPIGSNAFGSALSVFWAAVPIVGAQSGSTTGCPGASSVPAQLIPIFLDFAATAEKSGQAMGAALHSATLTVTTALAPPPALVPIT